jgi:hypothetical protein
MLAAAEHVSQLVSSQGTHALLASIRNPEEQLSQVVPPPVRAV